MLTVEVPLSKISSILSNSSTWTEKGIQCMFNVVVYIVYDLDHCITHWEIFLSISETVKTQEDKPLSVQLKSNSSLFHQPHCSSYWSLCKTLTVFPGPKMMAVRNYHGTPAPPGKTPLCFQTGECIELLKGDPDTTWWEVQQSVTWYVYIDM